MRLLNVMCRNYTDSEEYDLAFNFNDSAHVFTLNQAELSMIKDALKPENIVKVQEFKEAS